MENKHTLTDNTSEHRFEFDVEGQKAYIEYILQGGVMVLPHTFVPQKLEGRGIGSALVRAVLEEVKQRDLRIVPQCQFIAQYIYRYPEWEELVEKGVHAH